MQKKKTVNVKVIVSIIVIIAMVVFQYFFTEATPVPVVKPTQVDRFMPAGIDIKYEYDSNASFYCNDSKNFYFCTKDGLKYMTSTGNVLWNEIFNMTTPVMVGEYGLAAVAEERGKIIYVFNQDGKMYEKRFEYPISSFSINRQGYLTVILQTEDAYKIDVYYKDGEQVIYQWNYSDYNIFPFASDVSDDGAILAVNFLDMKGTTPKSILVYVYLDNEQSRNYIDGMFASKEKESEIIHKIKFMEGNKLITISDAEIACYAIDEKNSVVDKWAMPLNNELSKINFYKDKSFSIVFGKSIINKTGEPEGMIRIYNTNGIKSGEYLPTDKVTYLHSGMDSIIVGCGREYFALNNRAEVIWKHSATQDIKQIIFTDNSNFVLIATNSNADIYKKTRWVGGEN